MVSAPILGVFSARPERFGRHGTCGWGEAQGERVQPGDFERSDSQSRAADLGTAQVVAPGAHGGDLQQPGGGVRPTGLGGGFARPGPGPGPRSVRPGLLQHRGGVELEVGSGLLEPRPGAGCGDLQLLHGRGVGSLEPSAAGEGGSLDQGPPAHSSDS